VLGRVMDRDGMRSEGISMANKAVDSSDSVEDSNHEDEVRPKGLSINAGMLLTSSPGNKCWLGDGRRRWSHASPPHKAARQTGAAATK
jgi:hypothetical protein